MKSGIKKEHSRFCRYVIQFLADKLRFSLPPAGLRMGSALKIDLGAQHGAVKWSKKMIRMTPVILTNGRKIVIYNLEVVSKPQIRFKGKAQADRESAAYMGM
jgi:hypothetical protein